MLRSFNTTDQNYYIALESLIKRCVDKRRLINTHIKMQLTLKSIYITKKASYIE